MAYIKRAILIVLFLQVANALPVDHEKSRSQCRCSCQEDTEDSSYILSKDDILKILKEAGLFPEKEAEATTPISGTSVKEDGEEDELELTEDEDVGTTKEDDSQDETGNETFYNLSELVDELAGSGAPEEKVVVSKTVATIPESKGSEKTDDSSKSQLHGEQTSDTSVTDFSKKSTETAADENKGDSTSTEKTEETVVNDDEEVEMEDIEEGESDQSSTTTDTFLEDTDSIEDLFSSESHSEPLLIDVKIKDTQHSSDTTKNENNVGKKDDFGEALKITKTYEENEPKSDNSKHETTKEDHVMEPKSTEDPQEDELLDVEDEEEPTESEGDYSSLIQTLLDTSKSSSSETLDGPPKDSQRINSVQPTNLSKKSLVINVHSSQILTPQALLESKFSLTKISGNENKGSDSAKTTVAVSNPVTSQNDGDKLSQTPSEEKVISEKPSEPGVSNLSEKINTKDTGRSSDVQDDKESTPTEGEVEEELIMDGMEEENDSSQNIDNSEVGTSSTKEKGDNESSDNEEQLQLENMFKILESSNEKVGTESKEDSKKTPPKAIKGEEAITGSPEIHHELSSPELSHALPSPEERHESPGYESHHKLITPAVNHELPITKVFHDIFSPEVIRQFLSPEIYKKLPGAEVPPKLPSGDIIDDCSETTQPDSDLNDPRAHKSNWPSGSHEEITSTDQEKQPPSTDEHSREPSPSIREQSEVTPDDDCNEEDPSQRTNQKLDTRETDNGWLPESGRSASKSYSPTTTANSDDCNEEDYAQKTNQEQDAYNPRELGYGWAPDRYTSKIDWQTADSSTERLRGQFSSAKDYVPDWLQNFWYPTSPVSSYFPKYTDADCDSHSFGAYPGGSGNFIGMSGHNIGDVRPDSYSTAVPIPEANKNQYNYMLNYGNSQFPSDPYQFSRNHEYNNPGHFTSNVLGYYPTYSQSANNVIPGFIPQHTESFNSYAPGCECGYEHFSQSNVPYTGHTQSYPHYDDKVYGAPTPEKITETALRPESTNFLPSTSRPWNPFIYSYFPAPKPLFYSPQQTDYTRCTGE